MYIVRAGRLVVVDETSGAVIRELGRGDALGELGLLTDSPRSASVRAARASDVIAVDREDFAALLQAVPALSLALNRSLGRQLRDARAPAPTTRPRPATVALVAADERVPLARLSTELARALGGHITVTCLTGQEIAPAGPHAEPATAFGPLLDRAEGAHELVLLEARNISPDDPWTRFCLQQADRILMVSGGGPVPAGIAQRPELRGCDLVAYDAPAGTLAPWASALDPIESHVIRESDFSADLARAARRLTGRSVGRRPFRRWRARLLAHRRARGADRAPA